MNRFLFFLFLLLNVSVVCSQNNVGIGTATPAPSSILDLNANDKGVLVPRLTTAQRLAIVAPANSLLVFDTDVDCFFYYSTATISWVSLCSFTGATGAVGPTGATGPAGGPAGPTGPVGPIGSGQIVSLTVPSYGANAGYPPWQTSNVWVNFSDLPPAGNLLRLTGEVHNSAPGYSSTIKIFIAGVVVWTSPPITTTTLLPLDSGLIPFVNPGGLAAVTYEFVCGGGGGASEYFQFTGAVLLFK